jgi:putative ABC transport system substrate-binding protein
LNSSITTICLHYSSGHGWLTVIFTCSSSADPLLEIELSGAPISAGFASSLAEPKVNMTGLSFMAPDLNGKRLEPLREIIPELHRVAVIANPEHPGEHLARSYSEKTGERLGLTIEHFPTRTQES